MRIKAALEVGFESPATALGVGSMDRRGAFVLAGQPKRRRERP